MEAGIVDALREALSPEYLEVVNESARHNVPAGSETHFKVVIAAGAFRGMSRLARHRMVNRLLAGPIAGGVHALALHAMTPDEVALRQGGTAHTVDSPACRGGDGTFT